MFPFPFVTGWEAACATDTASFHRHPWRHLPGKIAMTERAEGSVMVVGSQTSRLRAWKSSTSVEPVISFIPKKEGALPKNYGSTCLLHESCEGWQTLRSALAQKLKFGSCHPWPPRGCHPSPCPSCMVQPGCCYLGGITTSGGPRFGLHMRTWASLALGLTSALGGMGSIRFRMRGCSC